MSEWRADATVAAALIRRNFNEILRVPGAAVPGIIAPTIFLIGFTSVFGELQRLPGFTADDFISFLIPVTLLQAAAFSGAATGVNLARDIELGWFDRILVSRAPRPVILGGLLAAASLRSLLPITVALLTAFALGAAFPGVDGLVLAVVLASLVAGVAAAWASILAIRFKTQSAAPLMQATGFIAVLFTTAFAPEPLLNGWFKEIAHYNPMTQVLEAMRQGFIGGVSWTETWPGLVVIAALGAGFVALALRGLVRMGR
jgi:ABC-2 type transport system permease protein